MVPASLCGEARSSSPTFGTPPGFQPGAAHLTEMREYVTVMWFRPAPRGMEPRRETL
jgi:hypothetical protein